MELEGGEGGGGHRRDFLRKMERRRTVRRGPTEKNWRGQRGQGGKSDK